MAEDQKKRLTKEIPCRKRTREISSQTDEEDAHEVRGHACQRCCDANARLSSIKEKLSTLLQNIARVRNIQEKSKRSGARKQKHAK